MIIPYLKLTAKFRKSDYVVDVFGTMVEARSILVFMPDKLEDFGIARKLVDKLIQDFSKANFKLVLRQSYGSLLNGTQNFGTIFVSQEDVNFFGLPKKGLKQRVLGTKYDIVIDLNDELHLLSTYLCLKSEASLKICFEHRDREPFYNFYFRTQPDEKLKKKYQKLIKYLGACVTSDSDDN